MAITIWYAIITPRVVKKYDTIQQVERDAAGVAHESLSSIRMIAACGAEVQMAERYNKLIERAKTLGKELSPLLAIQHAPGKFLYLSYFGNFVDVA